MLYVLMGEWRWRLDVLAALGVERPNTLDEALGVAGAGNVRPAGRVAPVGDRATIAASMGAEVTP